MIIVLWNVYPATGLTPFLPHDTVTSQFIHEDWNFTGCYSVKNRGEVPLPPPQLLIIMNEESIGNALAQEYWKICNYDICQFFDDAI